MGSKSESTASRKVPRTVRLLGFFTGGTTTIRNSAVGIWNGVGSIKRQLTQKPTRDAKLENAFAQSFTALLANWGISELDLPIVKRGLRIACVGWSLAIVACLLWMVDCALRHDLLDLAIALFGAIACAAVASTRYWRLSVLTGERFIPYGQWIGFRKRG